MRLVLDTCVIVAAVRSRAGASNMLLRLVAGRHLTPLLTTSLFLEYDEVLKREDQRTASGMTIAQAGSFLAVLAAASEPVEVHFTWRPQLADANDELVLEAAVNGRADALVTFNIADFRPAAARFGIGLRTPGMVLEGLSR